MQDTYDYRQYDRVWQRVSPTLDPYPGADGGAPVPPAALPAGPHPGPARSSAETALPGAEADPCCMGSAAMEMVGVIQGFIEEELADRRYDLAFSRQAPGWARQTLLDLAGDAAAHARRLTAAHYLITGQSYRPAVSCESIRVGALCPALRARYHAEVCGGLNYARAADGTTDLCLTRLFNELSADEYRHAERLMVLLERGMRR